MADRGPNASRGSDFYVPTNIWDTTLLVYIYRIYILLRPSFRNCPKWRAK